MDFLRAQMQACNNRVQRKRRKTQAHTARHHNSLALTRVCNNSYVINRDKISKDKTSRAEPRPQHRAKLQVRRNSPFNNKQEPRGAVASFKP